ncbi:Abia family HEPN domain-containing protein [Lactobacillus acidophilus]
MFSEINLRNHSSLHKLFYSPDFKRQNNEKYVSIINGDWKKTYYLYFNFKAELDNKSYMEAYAYFKTYFDRMTALIAAYIEHADLNIKKYYKKNNLVAVYKNLQQNDAEKIIKKANKLRDRNPLVHSSSEMLGMPDWTENIKNMIKKLTDLIKEGINNIE